MSRKLKKHKKYGLGKAIGDKAAHLFAKWLVYTYPITRKIADPPWGKYSFELPLDSNAGRVLFRTGYLQRWVSLDNLRDYKVIQKREKVNYIRVTNIRKKAVSNVKFRCITQNRL